MKIQDQIKDLSDNKDNKATLNKILTTLTLQPTEIKDSEINMQTNTQIKDRISTKKLRTIDLLKDSESQSHFKTDSNNSIKAKSLTKDNKDSMTKTKGRANLTKDLKDRLWTKTRLKISGYLLHHPREISIREILEMITKKPTIKIKWEVQWIYFLSKIFRQTSQEVEDEVEATEDDRTITREERTNIRGHSGVRWTKNRINKECRNSDHSRLWQSQWRKKVL